MAKRLWFVRTRHKVTQYGITELRDRLAAAIVIARRYSRQCDALRQERDALVDELAEAYQRLGRQRDHAGDRAATGAGLG